MATIQVRVDDAMKAEVDALFADIGLDTSTAIRAFLKQSILHQGLPFPLTREAPNKETLSAIREVAEMEKHPEQYKRYASFAELVREVAADV